MYLAARTIEYRGAGIPAEIAQTRMSLEPDPGNAGVGS